MSKTIRLNIVFILLLQFLFAQTKITLPAVFSDNMVLQQSSKVNFWGKYLPGNKITIEGSWGSKSKCTVGTDSLWRVKLKTPRAGGPFEVKISSGSETKVFKNVLVGEVWVCSGQSNMEMPMFGWPPKDTIDGGSAAIKNSLNNKIRLFNVTRAFSTKPEYNCVGSWVETTPETVKWFSATAYFFGRKLNADLNIPVGLIHTSWGGTPVEAWTAENYISTFKDYKDFPEKLKNSSKEIETQQNWILNHPVIDITGKDADSKWKDLNFDDIKCKERIYNDSDWRKMKLPVSWEYAELGNFDGVVWFRKHIKLPDNWVKKELVLELGTIDDVDITFVNGSKVGGYEGDGFWQTQRIYSVSPEINDSTELVISVRVIDSQGGGGIWGATGIMKIGLKDSSEKISLDGEWLYLPVAEYKGGKFFVYGENTREFFNRPKSAIDISAYTPTTLFNAMINPIVPYNIKGAIWYQGEANTGNPEAYKTLLPLMIKNWRDVWGLGEFPFYFAQIAPYNYGETQSQKLREAQLVTLKHPNTGMAVTLDIGNPENVHPGNKKDAGERLAFWALNKNYKKNIVPSGPVYKSMKIDGNKIKIEFDYAGNGLIIKKENNEFQIADDDKVFKKADVKIEGKYLIFSNKEIAKPAAVRYGWSNTPEAVLFNNAGLPASSFRTDNWE